MKIVVGYDGSEHADRALARARAIAGENEVIVVAAARLTTLNRDPGSSPVDPLEVEEAQESLEKAKHVISGNARFVEAHGDPADALVRVAKDEGADLIVIGTRGLNFAQRALLGSVSTKVVHHAECDVLVVR